MPGDTTIWDGIMKRVRKIGNAHVRVGVLQSKGGGEEQGGITIVELAAIHEFGSPAAHLPERSFIRLTFARPPWLPGLVAKLAKAVLEDKLSEKRALEILGQKAAAEVKATITEKRVRPLSQKAQGSIARGEAANPTTLVDTGQLKNSINYDVVEGAGGA